MMAMSRQDGHRGSEFGRGYCVPEILMKENAQKNSREADPDVKIKLRSRCADSQRPAVSPVRPAVREQFWTGFSIPDRWISEMTKQADRSPINAFMKTEKVDERMPAITNRPFSRVRQ
jgi:hypothetical protein